jgi:hypothetical protein
MRVGEVEGGPDLAEQPVTRGSVPRAAHFSQRGTRSVRGIWGSGRGEQQHC